MLSIETVQAVLDRATCLYSPTDIQAAMDKMASEMTEAFADKNPLLLCVMIGGLNPMGMLLERLHFPLQVDYIHATRYGHATVGQTLEWLVKPRADLTNREVIIVDDILDGGVTLAKIVEWCEAQGAKAVHTCAMVDKDAPRVEGGLDKADFTALHAENRYLFGYGLDYKGYLRNAPGIYSVAPEDQ